MVRRRIRFAAWILASLTAGLLVAGVVFAGSPSRIAAGVSVAGVDLGGLTASEARAKLSRLAAQNASVPVVFTAGSRRWSFTPSELELRADWGGAVDAALAQGDGRLPLRGLTRLKLRLLGANVEPRARVYGPGLDYRIDGIGDAFDVPAREAAIVLRGLRPVIVPARPGREVDRAEARALVVASLTGFERERVSLPVVVDEPEVTRETLLPVAAQVRRALAAPVFLRHRGAEFAVRPADLARLLDLPAGGSSELGIDRRAARGYLANIARGVARSPASADFAMGADGRVRVVRARNGRALDVAATGEALLAAAAGGGARSATLVIDRIEPRLTTAEARGLRIERRLASYVTLYSGTADRIQNLQRAVSLLDGAVVAPGATFSFNERVGPRTEERGFRPAPVIVDGEYEDGIGGGVSQVATTLFNAAWEAGLKITGRTAHALYIDRYPLGRDATVNYPDIDLKLRNDTGRYLVIEAGYDESGIVIGILGAGAERRVVSEAGELEETAAPRIERKPDPNLFVGERVIEDMGEPARAVRVLRTVYVGESVLYEESWYTSYRSEPRIVRMGTKPKPVEQPPPPPPPEEKKKDEDPPPPGGG